MHSRCSASGGGVSLQVGSKEPVQHNGVARAEVLVDLLRGHPPIQGLGRVGVVPDGVFLEWPVLIVSLPPQPRGELADGHLPQPGSDA